MTKSKNETIIHGRIYEQLPYPKMSLMVREDGSAVLEILGDGTIFWEGRKVTTDAELVDGLYAVIGKARLYKLKEE
jgi:hypothetical protein